MGIIPDSELGDRDTEIGAVEIKDGTTAQRAVVDAAGNQVVTLGQRLAGEDIAQDVQKVEQRFTYAKGAADFQVDDGPGVVHSITFSCADAAPTAGTISLLDAAAAGGTPIIYSEVFDTTAFRGHTIILDCSYTTALYVDFTTTADVNVTVTFRSNV